MSGLDRVERLRALQRGVPSEFASGAPALRLKVEAESEGRSPELDEGASLELARLLAMLEAGFLAAAADGELGEDEVLNLAGNIASWLDGELEADAVAAILESFASAFNEQGFEARLGAIAGALDPDSRRAAYNFSAVIVLCDSEVHEGELGVLSDIAGAFDISEEEAQARFDEIYDQIQAAQA